MKTAQIQHAEVITQYYKDGAEVFPTPTEKLANSIYGGMEVKRTERKTTIAVVEYKTGKELADAFWKTAEEFAAFIPASDLIIAK